MTIVKIKDIRARKQILTLLEDLDHILGLWKKRDDRHMIYQELQKIKWMQMDLHDRLRRIEK